MDFEQLKNIVKKAGIVGAGGAGFPFHAKLNMESEYIIVNGAECEPLLHVDQHLMDQYAKNLLQTLEIIVKAVGAKVGIVALKKEYKKAVASLESARGQYPNTDVCLLSSTYPVGDEVTLIYECTGKVMPRGALPIAQKVTVINVETLLNVWYALHKEMSVTHSYVTVGGDVSRPVTLRVPIGMKIRELIQLAGRDDLSNHEIIMGGPMMGNMVSADSVVTKTTKALLILEKDHYVITRKEPTNFNSLKKIMSSCSQCRMCTDLCPRNMLGHKVEPHKLMNAVANGLIEHSGAAQIALGCCGCNICSLYACHHELDPAGFMMKIKGGLLSQGVKVAQQKESIPDEWLAYRRVPSSSLIKKLGLTRYDVDSPLDKRKIEPNNVEIPLKQHIGASAVACVQQGDIVKEGQIIAHIKEGTLGANIHASINGIIKNITEDKVFIERGM